MDEVRKAYGFIAGKVKLLVKEFPNLRGRYEYDKLSCLHCLEIMPSEIYYLDGDYAKWEENFIEEFIAHFPNQNISFFTEDSPVAIENVEFELLGSEFEYGFSIIGSGNLITVMSQEIYQNLSAELDLNIDIEIQNESELLFQSIIYCHELTISHNYLVSNSSKDILIDADSNKYSLAA